MLMKMSQYKSGTTFILSIFLANILLALLVAIACDLDALAKAKDEAYSAYHNAEQALSSHNTLKPAIVTAGAVGSTTVVGGRMLIGAIMTSVTAMSTPTGLVWVVTATIGTYASWYTLYCFLDTDVTNKRSAYYERVRDYEACANPPAKFTYTCDYCNTVYEFSEEVYGSASDAYTAYMKFIEVHDHY